MSYSTRRNRSTQDATRERLASVLADLVAAHGESIELDWGPPGAAAGSPFKTTARVVEHPDRTVVRNDIRYWCGRGWATRVDGVGGLFTLEVDADALPEAQPTARAGDVARRA